MDKYAYANQAAMGAALNARISEVGSQAAEPLAEIPRELGELDAAIERLWKSFGMLHGRLEPVLFGIPPGTEANIKAVDSARTGVGSRIEGCRSRVEELERSVRATSDSLAL